MDSDTVKQQRLLFEQQRQFAERQRLLDEQQTLRQFAEQQIVSDISLALRTGYQGPLTTALDLLHETYPSPVDRKRILVAAEVGIPIDASLRSIVDGEIRDIENNKSRVVKEIHAPRRIGLEVNPSQRPNFTVLSRA